MTRLEKIRQEQKTAREKRAKADARAARLWGDPAKAEREFLRDVREIFKAIR